MQEKPQRLDRFLTSQNIGSRRETVKLIRDGKVTVDEKICVRPEMKIIPGLTAIEVNHQVVFYQKYIYIMMNKPKGLICATQDKQAQTVLDIVPEPWNRRGIFPAGRLDKDTTGLLVITDDGDFAHRMLSPKKQVYKLYRILPERKISDKDIDLFAQGIQYGGIQFAPAALWTEAVDGQEYAFVKIHEGKFHQVKRMFEAVGNQVLELKRIKIGALDLDKDLQEGESRLLTKEERNKIFE